MHLINLNATLSHFINPTSGDAPYCTILLCLTADDFTVLVKGRVLLLDELKVPSSSENIVLFLGLAPKWPINRLVKNCPISHFIENALFLGAVANHLRF